MPHKAVTKGAPLFPQDRIHDRVARRIYQEFLAGNLTEEEFIAEMEALDDYVAGD